MCVLPSALSPVLFLSGAPDWRASFVPHVLQFHASFAANSPEAANLSQCCKPLWPQQHRDGCGRCPGEALRRSRKALLSACPQPPYFAPSGEAGWERREGCAAQLGSCSAPQMPLAASKKWVGKVSGKQKGFSKSYILCYHTKLGACGGNAPREQVPILSSTSSTKIMLYSTYIICFSSFFLSWYKSWTFSIFPSYSTAEMLEATGTKSKAS